MPTHHFADRTQLYQALLRRDLDQGLVDRPCELIESDQGLSLSTDFKGNGRPLSCFYEALPLQAFPPHSARTLLKLSPADLPRTWKWLLRQGLTPRLADIEDNSVFWLLVEQMNENQIAQCFVGPMDRVYQEVREKIWTPWGRTHPLLGLIPDQMGMWWILSDQHPWQSLPIPQLEDTGPPIGLHPAPVATRPRLQQQIPIRLRMQRGIVNDTPRLWILRESALSQLTEYCRSANELLLHRFAIAATMINGKPCVILRANTGKGPPPIFIGDALSFLSYQKLPNLYLPEQRNLSLSLRRDAIRKVLAARGDRTYWMLPTGEREFQLESIVTAAFRPLNEFVEYRCDVAISRDAWFDGPAIVLESFQEIREEPVETAPIPARESAPRPAQPKPGFFKRIRQMFQSEKKPIHLDVPRPETPVSIPVEEAIPKALNQGDRLHLARPEKSTGSAERLAQLEARFLKKLEESGAESVQSIWPELAAAYDGNNNAADASLCWLNAAWNESKPTPLYSWGWLRSEAREARPELKPNEPEPWLSLPPNPGTTRVLAAWVVWANAQNPRPSSYASAAAAIQARLDAHSHWLPIRALWLARSALASSGDVLGLARSRDELNERLLSKGLSLELDVPTFLRFAGDGVRERYSEARRWLIDKRELIHHWLSRLPEDTLYRAEGIPASTPLQPFGLEPDVVHSIAYADLMIAWGLTRFVETQAAEPIRGHAWAGLPGSDPVHGILREAFDYRISQVREARTPKGPWPDDLLKRLEKLDDLPRYVVEKLRECSVILEPDGGFEAFRTTVYSKATAYQQHSRLDREPMDKLTEQLPDLLKATSPPLGETLIVLLRRISEFEEPAALLILKSLQEGVQLLGGNLRQQARLIEKGLAAATHWDQPAIAVGLAERFRKLADGRSGWEIAEAVTAQVFRSLRRLGLKPEADRVLNHIANNVTKGQGLLKVRYELGNDWSAALRVLLHAAAGWYFVGRDEDAHAILDEARKDLYSDDMNPRERTQLALTYAHTLGQAPVRIALGRFEELFQRLRGIRVTGATNTHYALQPLRIVEAAVRAIVSEDFALGPAVRAWLERDELVFRRRIREELKDRLQKSGL